VSSSPDSSRSETDLLPERVHLPLLTLITHQSLDEDYLVAAEQRAAGAPRPPKGRPHRVAAVVVAVFGVLVSTAFVQTSQNADVDDAGRATLIDRLESERAVLSSQQERVAALRDGNLALEASLGQLADTEQEALVRNRRLQVRAGFIGVTGEGVRVTVQERPDADEVQQIHDSDLTLLVNGLWEAGAEAISVNGQRLTSMSAIRIGGQAILVNNRGVSAPYVVTTSGLAFAGKADFYGFTYDVENVGSMSLQSGPQSYLRLLSASTDVGDVLVENEPPARPRATPTTEEEP
jgi:uncharacterized protein YlxW (UPF0749 family)